MSYTLMVHEGEQCILLEGYISTLKEARNSAAEEIKSCQNRDSRVTEVIQLGNIWSLEDINGNQYYQIRIKNMTERPGKKRLMAGS